MSEKGFRQNKYRNIEKSEEKKIEYDHRNPQTWREGEVIDVGPLAELDAAPLEEFNKYRKEIIIKSLKEAVNELAKRKGLNQLTPEHLKFIEIGERQIEWFVRQTKKVPYGGEFPDSVIIDSLLELVKMVFSESMWRKVIKKTGNKFLFKDFLELIVKKTVDIAKSAQRPKEMTEYWKPYKDAYVLLTGDNRRTDKLSVAGFSTTDNKALNKIFKFINIRKEAFRILEKEERDGKAKDLVNEVLEHEYQEIEHFMNPAEADTPHKADRDKKYLEVLKILRKRKYFH